MGAWAKGADQYGDADSRVPRGAGGVWVAVVLTCLRLTLVLVILAALSMDQRSVAAAGLGVCLLTFFAGGLIPSWRHRTARPARTVSLTTDLLLFAAVPVLLLARGRISGLPPEYALAGLSAALGGAVLARLARWPPGQPVADGGDGVDLGQVACGLVPAPRSGRWRVASGGLVAAVGRGLYGVGMVAFTVLAAAVTLNNPVLVVERPTLHLGRLAPGFDGLTVAVLADLHAGWGRDREESVRHAVGATNALDADLVVLLGDVVNRPADGVLYVPLLSGLRARDGVWACLGNHEHGVVHVVGPPVPAPSDEEWRRIYAAAGVHLLVNEAAAVRRGDARLWIVGVDDAYSGRDDLARALRGVSPKDACLVITHHPDVLDDPLIGHVDLLLAGHTHGGAVRLPLLGPVWVSCRKPRERAEGLVRVGGTLGYVSRGTGQGWKGLRIWCPREITLMTLRAGSLAVPGAYR